MQVAREILLRLMLSAAALSTVLFSVSSAANAQDASLDGKWTVKFTNKAGNPYESSLELKGTSGQYQLFTHPQRGKSDPCDKIAAPISLERSGDTLVVTVKYSEALQGCSNRKISLRQISERALEGAFGNGTPVSVTKN